MSTASHTGATAVIVTTTITITIRRANVRAGAATVESSARRQRTAVLLSQMPTHLTRRSASLRARRRRDRTPLRPARVNGSTAIPETTVTPIQKRKNGVPRQLRRRVAAVVAAQFLSPLSSGRRVLLAHPAARDNKA
ncbi:hypothetical protein TW95_gp1629 [Pandoravirus inopinatum]|uniref:Uncharacterized protein n=1 Tax=Pandoravirus inopinatum TaxID=1605721 RepID=A0A0B5IZM0_9VIRU|nr:hypothetical protein TW95_gp1629 [Pandoravirus inopinatum]AJF98363.1 hypothetical protein [Pandoravirus inopinatum]